MDYQEDFELHELSERDWNEIEQMARRFSQDGIFHKHPMRCVIYAFLIWCAENHKMPMVNENDLSFYKEH